MRALPVATIRLPAHPASSRAARAFTAEHLRSWGCEQTVDDATLLVSELVTNAVLHARAPVDVVVRKGRHSVRVEVFDEGTGVPQVSFSELDSLHGRGLGLVQAVATRWGVSEDHEGGKTVWFELSL
jgi:anti-sigma regulatory factor (Ser/Thr protein kinase)